MAEAAAVARVHESAPDNQKELKDSDMAAKAQKLMQISGEDDHEKKEAMKRQKTKDSKKKKKKTVKREKVPDFVNHQNQSEVTSMEISEEEDNFGPKRQKYRSLADIYKATEPVSALKSAAENQKERAATDQKLMQISGEDDHEKKVAMKREKTKDSKKKKQKMVKREKVPDFANHQKNQSEETSMEISEEEENFGPKRQKYRSLADIYKATEPGVYYP